MQAGVRTTLYVGGVAVMAAGVWGFAKYRALVTGDANMDRFAIRWNALVWAFLFNLDARYVMGIINQESAGDPRNYLGDTSSSHGPSVGPMQVSRDTAKALGLWAPPPGLDERQAYAELAQGDEATLIHWGCAVLADKLKAAGGDVELAVRLYNGSGAAAEAYKQSVLSYVSNTFPQPGEAA